MSLVTRVARSAALAAAASAFLAAAATSLLGSFLLQRADDRRLFEAARDLVFLLGEESLPREGIVAVVRHEHEEQEHAGIRFTVSDRDGSFIAGESGVEPVRPEQCATHGQNRTRVCSVSAGSGVIVTAVSRHTSQTALFSIAAVAAVALAGAATWFWSRPMARSAVAPLSRLRARVAEIDLDAGGIGELGPIEHVIEVDELRATIAQLLERVGVALEQAQRFAANAAHELRTPLTAVRAELELFGEHPGLPAPVAGNLVTAQSKVADLVVLVEKLLVLAAPKKRRPADPTEIVSLHDIMEDVLRSLEPAQAAKVQLTDSDALVRGDAVLLSTMFANALMNALKFGSQVRVDLSVVGGHAAITIDDDGPGLDRAEWESVFEPFYRGRGALRRRQPGHGLGLALVRHIAETHGGGAVFKERQGPGARLQISLPEMPG